MRYDGITNIQLARWLIKGHGQVLFEGKIRTHWEYEENGDDLKIPEEVKIRSWHSSTWHYPTQNHLRWLI